MLGRSFFDGHRALESWRAFAGGSEGMSDYTPSDLTVMGKALETFCRQHDIEHLSDQEAVASLILHLYSSGAQKYDELMLQLEAAYAMRSAG